MTPAIEAPFDTRDLRRALGSFVTGVTVITTRDAAGAAHGLTANSFSSVSLDPPLILWSQSTSAPSHGAFRAARWFAINVLAEDQVEVSRRFATGGGDKFAGVPVFAGLGDVPLIEGCAAHLECTVETLHPGGDHVVFVGRVHRIRHRAAAPLVFGGGSYLVARPHGAGAVRCRACGSDWHAA